MNYDSFYHSTNRKRVTKNSISKAVDLYAYNYNQFLPQDKNALIIDIGCSEGIAIEWLTKQGYLNVIGIDPDDVAIKIAQESFADTLSADRFLACDSLKYLKSLDDNSVDMFVMLNVVEHLTKQDLLELVKEIKRTLKNEGNFLAQTGNWENPFNIGLFSRDYTHHIMFTKNSLRQLLLMSGFDRKNIATRSVNYKTTIKNWPLLIITPIVSNLIKGIALSMRCRIRDTAPLIYTIATKES